MAFRNQRYLSNTVISTLKPVDYSQWERENEVKKRAVFMGPSSAEREKAEKKTLARAPGGKRTVSGSRSKMSPSVKQKAAWQHTAAKETGHAKSLENIRIMQKLSKNKMNSLDEMKHHSSVLLEKNLQLVEEIKEMDFKTVKEARELLQQYDMFGATIASLQDSSQNQVGMAKAELQATEKMVEDRMGKLDQERKRMTSKVQTVQDELNVLRTYMDKEYPVRAVQIASLLRSIRNLGEEQQDELEDTEELSKRFLDTLAEKVQEKEDNILQAVAEDQLSQYKDGLSQMSRNNMELRRQIKAQKELIDEMLNEIQELQKKIMALHDVIRDPREVIFSNVLLRRPRCHPDMEVVLDIPTEGDFPL